MEGLQLVFLGPPGAGKGTQAARLANEFDFKHLSTGNLLRKEVRSGSDLGKRVQSILHKGGLVDDDTILELVKSNCRLEDKHIFDGLPRNLKQAKLLDQEIFKGEEMAMKAFYFSMESDKLVERLVNRRICSECGAIFNLAEHPPKKRGVCDSCGQEKLIQRKDDTMRVVKNRINIFKDEIDPILSYYDAREKLTRLDASLNRDTVFKQIKALVANICG